MGTIRLIGDRCKQDLLVVDYIGNPLHFLMLSLHMGTIQQLPDCQHLHLVNQDVIQHSHTKVVQTDVIKCHLIVNREPTQCIMDVSMLVVI